MSDIVEFNLCISHEQPDYVLVRAARGRNNKVGCGREELLSGARLTGRLRHGPFDQCLGSEGWG